MAQGTGAVEVMGAGVGAVATERCEVRVRSGQYGNTSEHLRELIRRDQEVEAKRRLRELITEGLESGPARALTPEVVVDLKRQALGRRT